MVAQGIPGQELLSGLRVGFGMAVRRFTDGAPLRLSGAEIDSPRGLASAKDDGDIISLAVLDALLSASGMPGLSTLFPPDDPVPPDTDSMVLLSQTIEGLYRSRLAAVLNISVTLASPLTGVEEERSRMIGLLAPILGIDPSAIGLTFTAGEDFSAITEGSSAAAFVNILCLAKTVKDDARVKPKKAGTKFTEMLPLEAGPGGGDDDEHLPQRAREFNKAVKTKLPPLPKADPPREGDRLIVYTDGASRGNPGPAATGFVVLNEQGMLVHEGGSPIGECTNNVAEYKAVIEAAQWIENNLGREFRIEFRLDSDLVVRQLRGEWKVKDANLKTLSLSAMNQLMYFMTFELNHVPRKENARADAMANRALDGG